MRISEVGLALLKECEGFSARVYVCPAGKKTIGYGHVILAGECFDAGISLEKAEELLKKDVSWAEQAVCRCVTVGLNQGQFDALVCLVFNIGVAAFERSMLLRLLNLGDFAGAAAQFERWVFVGGKRLAGLERRRAKEKQFFMGKNK